MTNAIQGEKKVEIPKDVLGRPIKDLSKDNWWGLARIEIQWYPHIDYERCVGCGLCFMTCKGRVVYDWDFRNMRPIVARPYNCMVGCSTCADLCPVNAISFPSIEELRKYRNKARAVAKARKKLMELRNMKKGDDIG